MPKFPTYRGELPECLNPLNPRHYLLLLYWIFFRPTALKCYFYQADPDLYRSRGSSIFRTWHVPGYRNLLVMIPTAVGLLSMLIALPYTLLINWLQETPIDWVYWVGGMLLGVVVGVGAGAMFGVMVGVTRGLMLDVAFSVATDMVVGAMFGVMIGVVVGVVGVTSSVVIGAASSVVIGAAHSVDYGVVSGVLFGVMVGVGVLRLIFYPFQFALALCSLFRGVRHPLEWDELTVLPLPCTRRVLTQQFRQNEQEGIYFLTETGRNSFRRSVIQAVLYHHLHAHSKPLYFFYTLLTNPNLGGYLKIPMDKKDWERNRTTLWYLLLGELALQFVESTYSRILTFFDWIVWGMSYPLRERRRTPLTRFAGMLYELLDEETVETEEFTLSLYSDVYKNLSDYPGSEEIAQTFDVMATFLAYNNLSALPAVSEISSKLRFDTPIRPTVLIALDLLGQVGAEIATYQDSTSRANQMAALARATDALKVLDEYVQAEVMVPEQYLLRRIIRQWQQLIIAAGGELGRAEVTGPVANPYVAGNPVTGELFVGREDILRRLEELWRGAGQKPSVVLYGHRRMGKSSILHNLGARFGRDTVVVDFNMQRVGLVASTGELLYNLALAVYDSISPSPNPSHQGRGIDSPTPGPSQEGNAGETPALPGNTPPYTPLKGGIRICKNLCHPCYLGSILFFLSLLLTSCASIFDETIELRSKPSIVSRDDVVMMIRDYGFNHPADLSVGGLSGKFLGKFRHKYERKILDSDNVVLDHATGLMWQQSGSSTGMTWREAKAYVKRLNQERFAGYSDWRLPTIEELASLLEFTRQPGKIYIDPVFDQDQWICWSADIFKSAANVWFVYFAHGYVSNIDADNKLYVRAVRLM
jgi:hypothetical protein